MWIGDRLTSMEKLCISSFLRHGHDIHLYVYQVIDGVPPGTKIKDGNDVLPSSAIFTYRDNKSYAGFSNFFRYKLLLENGGWWVDTDVVCLRTLEFQGAFVFSSEVGPSCPRIANVGVMKAPRHSAAMHAAWEACRRMDKARLKWGQSGPGLIGQIIDTFALQEYVQPPTVFCPLSPWQWHRILDPHATWKFEKSTISIHLWNEMWRCNGLNKDEPYHPCCLYETLKRSYLNW